MVERLLSGVVNCGIILLSCCLLLELAVVRSQDPKVVFADGQIPEIRIDNKHFKAKDFDSALMKFNSPQLKPAISQMAGITPSDLHVLFLNGLWYNGGNASPGWLPYILHDDKHMGTSVSQLFIDSTKKELYSKTTIDWRTEWVIQKASECAAQRWWKRQYPKSHFLNNEEVQNSIISDLDEASEDLKKYAVVCAIFDIASTRLTKQQCENLLENLKPETIENLVSNDDSMITVLPLLTSRYFRQGSTMNHETKQIIDHVFETAHTCDSSGASNHQQDPNRHSRRHATKSSGKMNESRVAHRR